MSSFGSILNTINSSLISEVNRYQMLQKQNSTLPTSTAASDSVDFSQVGQLLRDLKQLQTSDPAEFKQVLTDASTQLKNAASQTSDPPQAGILNNLADKYQTAASPGSLSTLQPKSPSSGPYGLYAPLHHHRHHGRNAGAAPTQDQNVNSVNTLSGPQ